MHNWYALETYAAEAQAQRLAAAAQARLAREARQAGRSRRARNVAPTLPAGLAALAPVGLWRSVVHGTGARLVQLGQALQTLAAPPCGGVECVEAA